MTRCFPRATGYLALVVLPLCLSACSSLPIGDNPQAAGSSIRGESAPLPKFRFKYFSGKNSKGEPIEAVAKSPPPRGYTMGMAESYRLMRKRLAKRQRDPYVRDLVAPLGGNGERDALAHFQPAFKRLKLDVKGSEADRLRALYVLLYELGVRESDGRYYCGIDVGPYKSAAELKRLYSTDPEIQERVGEETEAGLFQSSWNFAKVNPSAERLYHDFKSGRRTDTLLEKFKPGTGSPREKDKDWGIGTGAGFQRLAKEAPNFAVEYAGLTLRKPGKGSYFFTHYDFMELPLEVLEWIRSLE